MSRWHSYLNSAKEILSLYNGEEPFASFLKKYFSGHKKFGSTDRKQVSHLCYCYFRLGKALPNLPVEDRILTALFFCTTTSNQLLGQIRPEWNDNVTLSVDEKYKLVGNTFSNPYIFPWEKELTVGINFEQFCNSFFIQPDLFLRMRPGKEVLVKEKLLKADIAFRSMLPSAISIATTVKLDEIIEPDKEAVVQDYSSQRVAEFIEVVNAELGRRRQSDGVRVWDCCAASGGKSIMAKDILGNIELTVSDIRESILSNLKKRFAVAGIKHYKSFIADLTEPVSILSNNQFDLIVADVPCTGSGTWSRTPEQLYYFDENRIEEYCQLQKKIITTIISHLIPGGHLLYITCSVFKKENEDVIDFIKEKFHLELIKMEILKGYDKKADTMFAALLKKPL